MIDLIKEYVTPERVTMVISVITTLLAVLKMATTMKSLKKTKETSVQDVLVAMRSEINKVASETTNEAILNVLKPISEQISTILPTLETFSKILALSQENTPESRVAILDLIQQLGSIPTNVIIESKNVIQEQVAVEEKKKEETITKLEDLGRV